MRSGKWSTRIVDQVCNDPGALSTLIHFDTKMTKEEKDVIDAMTMNELMAFCQYENPRKLSQFFQDKENMTRVELATAVKEGLRLSAEEIRTRGLSAEEIKAGRHAFFATMARYWCKVRPENFSTFTRADLMR